MSTLSLRKIKHDSSAVDNITLGSDGSASFATGLNVNTAYTGAYTDGTVVDYTSGLGRITVGASDGLAIYNGGPSARNLLMNIDAVGRITKPYQPCFVAVPSTSYGISGTTPAKINFNATMYNNGGYYSTVNQRFTAPVTGYYFTIVHAYIYGGSYDANVYVYKNGSQYVRGQSYNGVSATYGSNPGGATLSTIMYLTAGDYVEGWYSLNDDGRATNIYNGQNVTRFEMYLLG